MIIEAYHGSDKYFEKFDNKFIKELGFHFSQNKKICLKIYAGEKSVGNLVFRPEKNFFLYTCKLAIKNSIFLEDPGDWSNLYNLGEMGLFEDIPEYEWFSENSVNPIVNSTGLFYKGKEITLSSRDEELYDRALESVRNNFLLNNINCIKYQNKHEGEDTSLLILDSKYIKIEKCQELTKSLLNDILEN